ncbi:hypothetical protein SALBM217S_10409 [Streptomyces griseoloalbus]
MPGARSEAGHLARLIPGATLLADASATHTAVATALHHHAYAHSPATLWATCNARRAAGSSCTTIANDR